MPTTRTIPAAMPPRRSEIAYPDDRRAALVAALRTSNGETASLDLLARPGTVAVVTGQQVGLFSGPAYTIYKALTAVRLAARLSERGIPAVPMFWLATEDHDVAEVNHAFVFGPDHRPIQLSVAANGGSERPVGGIPIAAPPVDAPARNLGWFSAWRRSGGDGTRGVSGRRHFRPGFSRVTGTIARRPRLAVRRSSG